MSKYYCITTCVIAVAVSLFLPVIAITIPLRDSIKDLSDALLQPGIPTRVEIKNMVITNPDGVSFEISEFDATVDSRLIDFLTGLAVAEGQ